MTHTQTQTQSQIQFMLDIFPNIIIFQIADYAKHSKTYQTNTTQMEHT